MTKQGFKKTQAGLIPEDWNVNNIEELCKTFTKQTGFDYSNHIKPTLINERQRNTYPFIQNKDFAGSNVNFDTDYYIPCDVAKKFPMIFLNERCLLISISGSIGKVGVFNNNQIAFIGGAVAVGKFKDKRFLDWVMYYLLSEPGQRLMLKDVKAGSHQNLILDDIRKMSIPMPIHTEQKAIATALSDVDALIASLEQTITKKKAIKQGAMQALLNGKIRLNGFGETKTMKESEFGLIPEDWDVKLLPEVFDYIHGKAHEQHIDSTGIFTVVNSKFISTEGKVTKYSKENFCSARKGDILTVLSDLPNGKALAKTYFVNVDNKYAVNQRICIWRSKKNSPLFLSFIMNRHKYFMKFDDGVTQTHILNHHIEKCPVLVPRDLNEQNAIGQILSDMDAAITQLETKKEKYQAIKQGMMQELLTGKTRLI